MSFILYVLFAILVYRQASGKARYHPIFLYAAYILTVGTLLLVAYIGYTQNPKRKKLLFRDAIV